MIDDRSVLADVLDAMPDSLAVYELDGRVVYANPATERTFGRTLAELAGHRLFELFPDAVGNPFHAAFLRVAAGGPEESFDHYYPPFGRWFANRIRRVGDRIHVQARDATEDIRRRRRLEALERVSEVLASADDLEPDVATDAIAAGLAHLLDADCSIALLTDDATALELAATTHRLVRGEEIRWPADDGMPGEALRTHQTVLAEPAALAAMRDRLPPSIRSLVDREPPGSLLVAPLLDAEGPIGVVIATRGIDARPLTAEDRALVGEITGMVGLHLALARRRSEATSLRHRLSALTDSNPALVSFVGVDTRYQYVNATYERWFGLPRQAMIGQTMEALVGPEAWTTIEGHLRQALGGVGARFRAFLTYPSGGRHVDVQYLPVHGADGSVDGVAVLVFDISAEVALAEAERHRRAEERRATQRLESLLAVTGRLAGAADADEIARVVVDEGVDALDATLAGLWLVSSDRTRLELVRERGFAPSDTAAFRSVGLTGVDSPLFDCVSTGRPVWIESRGGYATRYPRLEALHRPDPPTPLAFAVLPLVIEGVSVGCVNFTFHDEQRLTPDERTYLEVLASHAAEAVRRARLYAEVRDASEAREALIGASPAAIVVLDEGGVVRTWNPAAERIFARPAWAVLDQPLDPRLGVLLEGTGGGREVRIERVGGEPFDAELYSAPVRRSDGRTMMLAMVVDVSDRRRTERGRQLVANANAILTRSVAEDETLERFVAVPVPEFADLCVVDLLVEGGQLERIIGGDPGVDVPRRFRYPIGGEAAPVIATGRAVVHRDLDPSSYGALARDEGHLARILAFRPRSAMTVPMVIGDRILGALSFASRTRNFDEVDEQIAHDLARKASNATENRRLFHEARTARGEAEAANRAKDQFLAVLGHELRNPLAPIATALHLMAVRSPDQVVRERAVIERQVGHLRRLVDDLLDVSRITRGKVELRRERAPVAGFVARGIELASPLLEERRHRLTVDVAPELAVHGDPTRLGQVVANLVANAAKYTEPGGSIVVRATRQDDAVELAVKDDGIGIPAEMLPTIFELFVQAPQGSARTTGGLGLGLAIVRSLVEQHDGTVAAHSDGPGTGTELVVRLPAVGVALQDGPTPVDERRRTAATRRILVVDDNEDAAVLLAEALGGYGHEIRTAFDGPSALRIAGEFRPQIAVLDLGLPVMDGYELAQRLRASPEPPARLVAVTGYGEARDRARSRAAGFDAHLVKPVSLDDLLRGIAEPA